MRGFSLIEFMVAITISMIILLAVSIAWQSGYATQRSQSDASRLNETVRFSIDLLSREIKQAGFVSKVTKTPELNFCQATTTGAAIAGVNDPLTINPSAVGMNFTGAGVAISNLSDAIRVRYYGDDTGAGGIVNGTSATSDCLGNLIPSGTLVEDTLYVAPDPNNSGEPALWCHTSNTPPAGAAASQPMVSGVESLQILYGEDQSGDGIVNRYVPAQLVSSFDNVLSVKLSIVARSANNVSAGTTAAKTYFHFGTPLGTPDAYVDPTAGGTIGTKFMPPADNRLRLPQPLSTEVAVRNFSNCSVQF
jgi:type IV pilus assembly protein PilW